MRMYILDNFGAVADTLSGSINFLPERYGAPNELADGCNGANGFLGYLSVQFILRGNRSHHEYTLQWEWIAEQFDKTVAELYHGITVELACTDEISDLNIGQEHAKKFFNQDQQWWLK